MVSTIHARLRSATEAAHLELERHLALLGPNVSMARYTRIIALFYGFYRPLEAGLDRLNARAPARGTNSHIGVRNLQFAHQLDPCPGTHS